MIGVEDEVEVVGHQAVGQDAHREAVAGLSDEADEGGVVGVLVEDLGFAVAAVQNVVAHVAESGSGRSGHSPKLSELSGIVKK